MRSMKDAKRGREWGEGVRCWHNPAEGPEQESG